MSRPSTNAPPYAVKTVTIAADGVEVFMGDFDFFSVIAATAPNNLEISLNDQGFQPFVFGSTLFGLNRYGTQRIVMRDTSGAPNTIQVAQGGANYQQANSSALAPGAATAANQVLEIAQLTTVNANLGGNLKVQGTSADGAAPVGNPVQVGGSDGANMQTLLMDTSGRPIVVGAAADGAAVAGNPVLVAGQDGTNAQSLKTDTTGRPEVVGPVAAGSAIGTAAPLLCGGSDGTNVQRIKTDTSGNQVAVGAVAAGSAIGTTAPVLVGVSDATNVQRLKGSTTGAVMVTGEAGHSAASVGNPVRVGGRVATAVDTTLVAGDAADIQVASSGAAVVQPYAVPEVAWQYAAAAGGILNTTTAVTIKAAAAAGVRNYITGVQIGAEALTNATELAIRDGASGTVIFRVKIPTAGWPTPVSFTFPTPLKGTAATLLEVVTLTASGAGAVYVNAQGYTAP